VSNLTKRVGRSFVLSVGEAVFGPGEITGLTGPNGSGKTTLLNLIAGLDGDFEGRILYDGRPFSRELRKRVTLCFQTPFLLNRSVSANIEYPLKIRKMNGEAAKRRAAELMAELGIERLAKKNAARLSGGESQKVALARALAPEPELLLLDEPFSSVDESSVPDMERCLTEYNRRTNATIILVSHDRRQIEKLCGGIVVLT